MMKGCISKAINVMWWKSWLEERDSDSFYWVPVTRKEVELWQLRPAWGMAAKAAYLVMCWRIPNVPRRREELLTVELEGSSSERSAQDLLRSLARKAKSQPFRQGSVWETACRTSGGVSPPTSARWQLLALMYHCRGCLPRFRALPRFARLQNSRIYELGIVLKVILPNSLNF